MFSTDFLDIPPLAAASGTVRLPGSKSISNRVLLLAALASGTTTIHDLLDSDDTRVMLDALRALGCGIDAVGSTLRIRPVDHGALALDAPIRVRGDVSSQFLTALLLALPLAARKDIVIEVVGELISKPYIEITLNLLARFGIAVQREGWERFTIPAGSRYSSPGDIHVEADASSASYFIALGAIATGASGQDSIRIEGVGADSIQGDIRFIEAARQMGAQVDSGPNWLDVRRGAWPLKAIDLDANHIPDAAMTLAVMALYADGPSTLRNIASWRVKETDRIDAMANELKKLGAAVEAGPDFIRVHPLAQAGWLPASIRTYDDHRVAMCFSLAAFNPAGVPVRILDPHCVAKTFPDYFETLFSVAEAAEVPVICIDGPTASGKGTLAAEVARLLGYHYLDSGSLYRVTGLAMRRAGLDANAANEPQIATLAAALPLQFTEGKVLLDGEDVSDDIRTEAAGMDASRVSALPAVREALQDLQHRFRRLPGLVADGRDMGTVIFPDAELKVFLTAGAAQRAERRHKQLISKGISTTLDSLRSDLEARDARDSSRSVAPLKPAQDARHLDNSQLSIEQSIDTVLNWWQEIQPFKPA